MEKIKLFQPVAVPKGAFIFCRYTISILIWISLILKSELILGISIIILLLSAIIGLPNAPLIFLWTNTLGKLFHSSKEMLDKKAMRFAHSLGTFLGIICLILLNLPNKNIGWIAVGIFAILKSISALGFCPASKIYSCMSNGGCCALTKR